MLMLNNYAYFIALAEERNISKAAQRLFISHQCLSRYLKRLEEEYNATFFERSPRLTLTPAGTAYLDMLRQVEFLEKNLKNHLEDIRQSKMGSIRFATTEGRYRVLIPSLLADYKQLYPDVELHTYYGTSAQLCERVAKNELDIALLNKRNISQTQFLIKPVISERLYMVISDHLLERYFPEEYPACKKSFKEGIDLARCGEIPFILNQVGFNSREVLDNFLKEQGLGLNCVLEMTQQDLHFMLAARDFAACFSWGMYIPSIHQTNANSELSYLNIFPIKGLTETNSVVLVMPKGKILPAYGRDLIRLIHQRCSEFSAL